MAYGSSQAIELDACHGIEPALSRILHEPIERGSTISGPTDTDVEVLLAYLQFSRFSVVS